MNNLDEREMLIRELRERSGDVDGAPIGFEAVRARAGKMQRRRNAVTGLVAAAVAAVALPTGVAVTAALNSGDEPGKDPTIAASPSEEPARPTPTPRPDGTFPLTIEGLPRGAAPDVTYYNGLEGAIVTPGGTVKPPMTYQQAIRYAGGWLALGYAGNGSEMSMLDENMEVGRTFRSGQSFALSNDGTQVAYVEMMDDGSQYLVNAPTSGSDPQAWSFPEFPAIRPVGVADTGAVVYVSGGENSTVGMVTAEDKIRLEGFVSAFDADINTGLVAGMTRSDLLNGSCYGVMDTRVSTSTMKWETCEYSLAGFSPDGRYLMGSQPDFDGMGPSTMVILEADTGHLVAEFSPPKDYPLALFNRTWEDEDTAVAIAIEGLTHTILRFEVDGHVEEAIEPVELDPNFGDVPLWFLGRRW